MALNLALLSFKFEQFRGFKYDPDLDHEFSNCDPEPGQGIQPVVKKAFKKIKRCLAKSVAGAFHFGATKLHNINNFIHIGTTVIEAHVQHSDKTYGQTAYVFTAKFYRLDPLTVYKVTVDIEQMPSSALCAEDPYSFKGMTNQDIEKLAALIDKAFGCEGQVEYIPIIKRGRLEVPHFLLSSDGRVLEYDFQEVLFHEKSDYQDVKILSSPSLGNTLVLDNLQNLAEVDLEYTYTIMDRGNINYKDKEVLVLGGGDGGVLYEILKESPKFVTVADLDSVVIEACRRYIKPCGSVLESLNGPNHKIVVDDCKKVLRQSVDSGKKYDIIICDLTDVPIAKREESLNAFESNLKSKDSEWSFIETIFNLSMDCLADDGVYLTHTTGKGNKDSIKSYEEFLNRSRVPVEFTSRTAWVPSFMECWVFYSVKKRT